MDWISVNDRLPDLFKAVCSDGSKFFASEDVLAFCVDNYGEKRQIVACFEKDDTGCLYTGWLEASEGTQLSSVTHWMPLPEPPKDA